MITDAQFSSWLDNPAAIRCVLVYVTVNLSGGGSETRRLSNFPFTTSATDAEPNVTFLPRITGGIKITQSISIDGSVSVSFGDIQLDNSDGALDSWLDDYWAMAPAFVYVGDPSWQTSDFRSIGTFVCAGIDSKGRTSVNIKLSDQIQRLNYPISSVKLNDGSSQEDQLIPLCFGECHNVTPLLTNAGTSEYQVHNGPIADIIEVRDNGVPVSFTKNLPQGKFTLNQAPVGTITASVQGAIFQSDIIWNNPNLYLTAGSSAIVTGDSPASSFVVYNFIPNTTNTQHFAYGGGTINPGDWLNAMVYVKMLNTTTSIVVNIMGVQAGSYLYCEVTSTGSFFKTAKGPVTLGGTMGDAFAVNCGNGWWGIYISGSPDNTSTSARIRVRVKQNYLDSFAGDGTTPAALITGPILQRGSIPLSPTAYDLTTGTTAYRNNLVDIITLLTTSYGDGNAASRFTAGDFDMSSFTTFMMKHQQPVGLYIKDRMNIIDACNQLASSVGARLVFGPNGAKLVKLDPDNPVAATAVTASQMLERSLQISSLPPVAASVKVGYCKNWTVQDSVADGVIPEHKTLYAEEYLTVTRVDTAAQTNYSLYSDPVEQDTLLQVDTDAIAEADRRLAIFNRQRKVLKYTGFYDLLFEQVGGYQTLTHPRFGLASGKTGQVLSVSFDLVSPHVDFEVLI